MTPLDRARWRLHNITRMVRARREIDEALIVIGVLLALVILAAVTQ